MLNEIQQIAIRAGEEILRFYGKSHPVDYKADDSPLTLADKAAHKAICAALHEFHPEIPIISEESPVPDYEERKKWKRFWLVDPLDGTKEFIKQTGEFTVNIALIVGGEARLGVVYVPVQRLTYMAEKPFGAFKQIDGRSRERIRVRRVPGHEKVDGGNVQHSKGPGTRNPSVTKDQVLMTTDPAKPAPVIVASRDHAGPRVKALLEACPDAETRSMGSSLKFCLVAEGAADLYLRDVPTMEWDTAAAQCIVEAAGGVVTNLQSGKPLLYNKKDIRNPEIVTIGDPSFPWKFDNHDRVVS